MNNIHLFPPEIRLDPNYGGLPGNICVRYTCPKCGHVVDTEIGITDLLQPLSLPCTNAVCPGYTLGVNTAFSAFGIALTGTPPEITLFDAEAEAVELKQAMHKYFERELREVIPDPAREFASISWTVADILDEDFGLRPDDRRWTPERAARLLERVEDDLMDAMSQAGRDLLESEMAYEETQEGHFEKRCPHCGSTDVQFYGQQTVEVIEDWSEGDSRDNFEFTEGPSGKWQNCTGHCLTCGEEWEVIPDSDSE